jgi:hypothetical protein
VRHFFFPGALIGAVVLKREMYADRFFKEGTIMRLLENGSLAEV